MSERLTSVEIEDVLSSIRRLVSEDLRPVARRDPAVGGREKLMLTPALRVVDDTPEPAFSGNSLSDEIVLDAPPLAVQRPLGEVVAKVGAGMLTDDWEAEIPADLLAKAGWAPETWEEAASQAGVLAEHDPENDVITLAAAAPDQADVIRPTVRHDQAWGADEDASEEIAVSSAVPGDTGPRRRPPLKLDPTAQAWADRAEAEALEEIRSHHDNFAAGLIAAASEAADRAGMFDDVDAPLELDADMLRELVRDIIREELQGALGERITRNVRKLVRAEINRALVSSSLE